MEFRRAKRAKRSGSSTVQYQGPVPPAIHEYSCWDFMTRELMTPTLLWNRRKTGISWWEKFKLWQTWIALLFPAICNVTPPMYWRTVSSRLENRCSGDWLKE